MHTYVYVCIYVYTQMIIILPAKLANLLICITVAPLVKVQNQLLGAPYGSNLTLVCEIQAMPKVSFTVLLVAYIHQLAWLP